MHWTVSTANQDVVKMKGSGPVRSNTTVSLMSTVFYTVSFFCSLWKFLLKPAKNKVLCKDVRFFETWNALINRLDEISLMGLCSLNSENCQRKLTYWMKYYSAEWCKYSHPSLLIVQTHNEQPDWVSSSCTQQHCFSLFLVNVQDLSYWRAEADRKSVV